MLAEFLRERMAAHPGRALRDETQTIIYREATAFADCFARQLTLPKYGILCRSELNVGLGVLSCLAAGCVAVPLSARYGQTHMDRIVRHVGLTHILTDADGELAVRQIAEPREATCEDLSDVAMIMCTSGTTGAPKGAMITHDNLMRNLLDIERYFRIGSDDTILIARPLYHCAVMTGEFLISLCRGLDIVFYGGEFSPVRLAGEIRARRATVLCGTPTLLYHLSRLAVRAKEPLPLKAVAVSGECMTATAAQAIRVALPDTAVYNVYGLTEAGPRVSALPPELFDGCPASVGYPLRSVDVKLEDGELLVSSPSVMKGYYRDSDLTSRALAGGWLHTGDAAKIDSDGKITVNGRLDSLIIRAGINIYPQEVENALKGDPRITEALAYGMTAGVTEKLCLKVSAPGMTRKELMSICRERLPAYAIPDAAELVDSIPRNASGKLIRPKLTAV